MATNTALGTCVSSVKGGSSNPFPSTLTDGTCSMRQQIRGDYFYTDKTIAGSLLGFDGVLDTDWEVVDVEAFFPASISDKMLFWGKVSEISAGEMPNRISGASDFLTVGGSAGSYTFECPNTAPYLAADTDNLWFSTDSPIRTVTEAECIGYDFSRTIIKYDNTAPYSIREIIILSDALTTEEMNSMRSYMELSIWWDNTLSIYGNVKGNRLVGKSEWVATVSVHVLLSDGKTYGRYAPLDPAGAERSVGGEESIYYDMMYGSNTFGVEQNSGVIIANALYKITATQDNFFYAGCLVGDTFICSTVKTCDANNKVKRYIGNHLTQPTLANQPINGVFDGSNDFLRSALGTLNQPTMIYMVVKQITYTAYDSLIDGSNINYGKILQYGINKIAAGSPTQSTATTFTVGQLGILRVLFSGASSKVIVNNNVPITENIGTNNMNCVTLGVRGDKVADFANMEFKELIVRIEGDSVETETTLYNYLASKYNLATI